ncbi:anthocyanin 3'-O-beta-glucosyltransferase-like [Dioscorea cayenensis subsp. rotundata]|uniref:Glycosyltransferase n=1 Tax=Dioscorea cayennensis subsp. rotundata TaxID=55577 RepID=A0AB40D0D2_DIOCR|nr:anthocyanin 3'-O-beta-glucosyltransferase-like [Dioscorea cayenensis subsp. rotundata]
MAFAGEEGGGARKLWVFFMPFFATSHIIPITDLACLFAGHPGVEPTIVTTPANANLIRPTLDRHAASGCHVHLLLHPFPSVDLPYAIIADICYWWTTDIAGELGIPRITSHAAGVFPQIVMNNLVKNRVHDNVPNDSHPFTIPDLPGPEIKMVKSELPEFLQKHDFLTQAWDDLKRSQLESYGVVVNTFYEFEREYCDLFKVVDSQRAWFVGPLALRGKREVEAGFNKERCMRWLEKKEIGSVVFVCFGSWCHFKDEQLRELALGLEGSGMDFIWVVRGGDDENMKMEWMPEGWEERVKDKGLVFKGWVPQAAILGHEGVGVFMTHCGWNSVMEGLSFGKPMLTWPLAFDHFISERLLVEVLKVGVRVWDGFRSTLQNEKVVVPAEAIARAMKKFSEKDSEEMKKRAMEWKKITGATVEKDGSSYKDLNCLIDELLMFYEKKKNDSIFEHYLQGMVILLPLCYRRVPSFGFVSLAATRGLSGVGVPPRIIKVVFTCRSREIGVMLLVLMLLFTVISMLAKFSRYYLKPENAKCTMLNIEFHNVTLKHA